jgi:membrane associated rhomboid family serine protease
VTQPQASGHGRTYPNCDWHPDVQMAVRCSRCSRPICADCSVSADVGFHCPDCVREGHESSPVSQAPWRARGGRVGALGPAPVTKILIALNAVVFVATFASQDTAVLRAALIPAAVTEGGEWWRLVSSMFMHGSLLHIGFNMFALWILGSQLEAAIGRWWYLGLYFVAGLAGGLWYVWLANPLAAAVGASGAIFGLFGAMGVLAWRRRGTPQGQAIWRNIAALLVINLLFTFAVPGIAWQAHLGGLVAGALFMALLDLRKTPTV